MARRRVTPKAGNIRDRIRELRRVPASELLANPKNWRRHPKAQQDALRGVLTEIGYAGALLARETDDGLMLIDGHLRAETTPDALVPVLVLDVTEAEADTLLATLDPLAAMAERDDEALRALLSTIETSDADVRALVNRLVSDAGTPRTVVEDGAPDPPTDPITKSGDLWILGDHRLLCGDATNADDVDVVMGGRTATCVFTDPPYGVAQAAKNRMLNDVAGGSRGGSRRRNETDIVDDGLSPDDLKQKLLPAFRNIRDRVTADDCTVFVTAPQGGELGMMMMMMMQESGLKVRHVLIWKKNAPTFSMGRLDYDYQHEPILLTWGRRHKRPMCGAHKTSVWEIDKPRASAEHPTMKPVELYANAYLNNSDDGDVVFDAYAGSGTAFIAAEQVGRVARGIEISPHYCDVIVRRWEALTGKTAERRSGGSA